MVTATLAGADFGYALLWALLFAMLATLVLQEMSLRLALITGQGLAENIRQQLIRPCWRISCSLLVVAAVVVGNAAYQGGNIAGASMGLTALVSPHYQPLWPLLLSALACLLLWYGRYALLQQVMVGLVVIMSMAFIAALFLVGPNWQLLFRGLLQPSVPTGAGLTVVALIGTSVVPYNLFLHASTALKRWQGPDDLVAARRDLSLCVPIGTLVSMAIMATAATAFFGSALTLQNVQDIAPALSPVFGEFATWAIALGLLAAGLSSALTAPLAAAFALCGLLGRAPETNSVWFRAGWLLVLFSGALAASLGIRPVGLIVFAQTTNGLLLPVLVVLLLWLCNQPRLGRYRNQWRHNVLGILVLLISCMLSVRMLGGAWGWL